MARIFLCHASDDKAHVRKVYHRLQAIEGFQGDRILNSTNNNQVLHWSTTQESGDELTLKPPIDVDLED